MPTRKGLLVRKLLAASTAIPLILCVTVAIAFNKQDASYQIAYHDRAGGVLWIEPHCDAETRRQTGIQIVRAPVAPGPAGFRYFRQDDNHRDGYEFRVARHLRGISEEPFIGLTILHVPSVVFLFDKDFMAFSPDAAVSVWRVNNGFFLIGSIIIALPSTYLILGPALRLTRNRRRLEMGLCLRCGYDLRSSGCRCPECGSERGKK
jgi:hypothetical protein